MKAAVNERYGGPDVIEFHDVQRPDAGPHDMLVRVKATTVSRTDCGMLRAHPSFARLATGLFRPKVRILGIDFAGVLEKVGASVSRFHVGDRVFGLSPVRFGAHAEYLLLHDTDPVALIPEGIDHDEAVVCEGAWYANSTVSELPPGGNILIYGASGAIGTAAVQLAKARGANVTAVVGPQHMELARTLGADQVVDYTVQDFAAVTERFDIVFDAVGKTSYFACRKLLKPSGAYRATDLGPGWSNIWLELVSRITGSRRVAVPLPADARAFVDEMRGHLRSGRYRAVIDRHYPLCQIAAAYRFVETEQKTGIVVIDVA